MARRNKKGLADDLLDITARMPWWAGVGLALVTYLVLHAVAKRPVPPLQPGKASDFMSVVIFQGLATGGQYLLPFIFLLGAGLSALKRRQAVGLHDAAANQADGVASMSWREFETLVGEYFRRQGYAVIDNGGGGPDGGVDVVLQKGSDRYLVQCKHWRALRVGVQPVRELYGVMAAKRVAGGFVVTSGDFTEEARSFAQGREVQLINGKALQSAIRAQAASVPRATAASQRPMPQPTAVPTTGTAPSCPLCNAQMVLRQARSGPTAGKKFWGCSQFAQTKCRGTRELT